MKCKILLALLLCLTVIFFSCKKNPTEPDDGGPKVASVSITAPYKYFDEQSNNWVTLDRSDSAWVAVIMGIDFRWEVKDDQGNDITDQVDVTLHSSDESIAAPMTEYAPERITGISLGSCQITASASNVTSNPVVLTVIRRIHGEEWAWYMSRQYDGGGGDASYWEIRQRGRFFRAYEKNGMSCWGRIDSTSVMMKRIVNPPNPSASAIFYGVCDDDPHPTVIWGGFEGPYDLSGTFVMTK